MKLQWGKLTDDFIGKKDFFLIDASSYSFFKIIKYQIDKYVKGRVLDAGAGRLALKFLLNKKADKYYSMDKYITRRELNIAGDLLYPPLKEKIFDTIVCLQVIEHAADPDTIIKNLSACLKGDGIFILSAPHITYLHGEPEDYYRYTKYGLAYLAEKHGLRVLDISAAGSIFGYLFVPLSDVILAYTYKIPILFPALFFLNYLGVQLISWIDTALFKNSIMPVNYIMVAQRR